MFPKPKLFNFFLSFLLITQELGYDVVEFNASDTRSKKLLQQSVSNVLNTTALGFGAKEVKKKKFNLNNENIFYRQT